MPRTFIQKLNDSVEDRRKNTRAVLVNLYMRGFRDAVDGDHSRRSVHGLHTSVYKRGFDAGLASVVIAGSNAREVASIMVKSPVEKCGFCGDVDCYEGERVPA